VSNKQMLYIFLYINDTPEIMIQSEYNRVTLGSIKVIIRPYVSEDEDVVVELWHKCELTRPWNDPRTDIKRKLELDPALLLVGVIDDRVIATVMGGYDGHRGWVYYLAVDPSYQRSGYGQQMMEAIEDKLFAIGCPKINLLIRAENKEVMRFYQGIGYNTEEIVTMGKRLIED